MRLSESMSAGMQTIELSASVVVVVVAAMHVCAHSRAIQSICVMVIACNYTKSHLCKYKNSSCTYAILSQIL